MILRDLVNATVGFEQLAKMTDVPSKSLQRVLSSKGNPSMDNLAAIVGAVSSMRSCAVALESCWGGSTNKAVAAKCEDL